MHRLRIQKFLAYDTNQGFSISHRRPPRYKPGHKLPLLCRNTHNPRQSHRHMNLSHSFHKKAGYPPVQIDFKIKNCFQLLKIIQENLRITPIITLLWQSLNVSPLMMLHILFAQWWRFGLNTQGSVLFSTSGHLLDTFQLLAKSTGLLTGSWPWVVKSFWPSPSKSPHRPHTFPCRAR